MDATDGEGAVGPVVLDGARSTRSGAGQYSQAAYRGSRSAIALNSSTTRSMAQASAHCRRGAPEESSSC